MMMIKNVMNMMMKIITDDGFVNNNHHKNMTASQCES